MDKETDLDCYVMTSQVIHIRADLEAIDAMQKAGNMMQVIVQSVRMPVSTAPIINPTVFNFEVLPSNEGSLVYSLLDTTR